MTMLYVHDQQRSAGSRFHGSLASTLAMSAKRVLLWPFRVAQARRELALLSRFSEYELRDIGLSSQDLRNATALPLDSDPTAFLARQAAEHARTISAKH